MTDTIVKKCHVYQAMNEVKEVLSKMGGITKDRQAPAGAGGYVFRGIDDMFNVLCGLTAEKGLLMIPRAVYGAMQVHFGKTTAGKAQVHVILPVEIDFISSVDGSLHTGCFIGEAMDTGDKASNKAMAAAFKYAHLHPFQIPTHGESDDTEAYHEPPAPREPAKQAANGAGPSVTKASPTAAMRQEAAAEQPALVPDNLFPATDQQVVTLAEAATAAKTIPVLYEIAKDAQKENADQATWGAIKGRLVTLLKHAKDIETLKSAKGFIRDLGAPNELTLAANKRFQELNSK